MVQVQNIDMSGVSRLIGGLHNALVGTGGKGDLADVVVDETKLLAQECGSSPTSRQRKRIEGSMRADVGKVFLRRPDHPFTGKKKGRGDIEWFSAGPGFLFGANKDRIIKSKGMVGPLFYKAKGRLPKQKFFDAGRIEGGLQHAILAQRFVVVKSAINKLFKQMVKRIGIRDASFAETAEKLGGKVASSSSKHFPTGKNVTDPHILGYSPTITFGSKARGISGLAQKVQKAVKAREAKMAYKLRLILTGYARDNNSGRPVTKKGRKP